MSEKTVEGHRSNIIEKLGLPKDYKEKINIDELDPSTFSMDMFSAEDLLGQGGGSALVDYNGYDYKGNKTTGATNLNEFLNKKDAKLKLLLLEVIIRLKL